MEDRNKPERDREENAEQRPYGPAELDEHEPDPAAVRSGSDGEPTQPDEIETPLFDEWESQHPNPAAGGMFEGRPSEADLSEMERPEEVIPEDYAGEDADPRTEEDAREELERQAGKRD